MYLFLLVLLFSLSSCFQVPPAFNVPLKVSDLDLLLALAEPIEYSRIDMTHIMYPGEIDFHDSRLFS